VGVFNERGYDGTSMEDLARAAGITKSSIYHHVKGKEALLEMALDTALGALFDALDETASTEGPARDRLEDLLRRSVEVLDAELPNVTLLLRVRGNTPTELAALERRREFDRRVTELVTQAVAEGDLRDDLDPALVTRLLFGTVNSLVEWYRPDHGASAQEVADGLVALLFEGLDRR
jgi:AcrR family transcriptional regulator